MARAIRCGSCGASNPLESKVGGTTQMCHSCGTAITIPPSAQTRRASDRPIRPPAALAPVKQRSPRRVSTNPVVRTESASQPRTRPWLVRVLAWVLAIPLAFLLVGIPARLGGYLTSQKLLDVIIKHNITRFVPVFLIILAWALATAILVTLIVEILSFLLDRRRLRRAEKRSSSSRPQALQTR